MNGDGKNKRTYRKIDLKERGHNTRYRKTASGLSNDIYRKQER